MNNFRFVALALLLLFSSACFSVDKNDFLNNRAKFEEKLNEQARVKATENQFYLNWDVFEATITQNCNSISKFIQGHSRVVHAYFTNGSYYVSIEPDIDSIYKRYKSCAKVNSSIKFISE